MTADELEELCHCLIGNLTLSEARKSQGIAKHLDDDGFILLMRFMSGERVQRPPTPANTPVSYPATVSGPYVAFAGVDEIDLDDDEGPTVLPGEFDGVTLP